MRLFIIVDKMKIKAMMFFEKLQFCEKAMRDTLFGYTASLFMFLRKLVQTFNENLTTKIQITVC